jgi:predicted nucleic acid-binding protein
MQLLISDTNILIDMDAGALMAALFQLPVQLGIPDVLYYEEIEPGTPGLDALGLQIMEVSGDFVAYAQCLPALYNHLLSASNGAKPDHNDYLALALAKQEGCTLLTGDKNLQAVAKHEHVDVMGTIGLMRCMVMSLLITVDEAIASLGRMKARNRRLPWALAEAMLNELR